MQVGPHPEFPALHSAMRCLRAAARPWSGVTYRFEAPKGGRGLVVPAAVREEALPQAIGRAACAAGFEGLLVPCAVDRQAVNIVVFPDNLGLRSNLTVLP